jgi:hypothetical protein
VFLKNTADILNWWEKCAIGRIRRQPKDTADDGRGLLVSGLSVSACRVMWYRKEYAKKVAEKQGEPEKNDVFWDVTPCGSCKNRRFGGTLRLPHQGAKNQGKRNNARFR